MADSEFKNQLDVDLFVKKAQNGDTDAFAKLYDQYVNSIFRYVSFRVPKEEALDITETVFLRSWEHLRSYRKLSGSFSSWIFRIAHNLVIDYYRGKKEVANIDNVEILDESRESNPKRMAENKLSQDALKKAIAKLKKKYQQILLLGYVGGLDNREIARIMNRNEGNLRILKFRALQALRKILEEMNISY